MTALPSIEGKGFLLEHKVSVSEQKKKKKKKNAGEKKGK